MTDLAMRKRRLAQVMRKIRSRVSARVAAPLPVAPPAHPSPVEPAHASDAGTAVHLPKTVHLSEIERKSRYRLGDFLEYHDTSFVRNAYLGLLGREPDTSGWDHHLAALRHGSLTKIEILGRIRYSREGRNRGTRVSGLWLPFAFARAYRVPLLGYLLRLPVALARLPRNAGQPARLEGYLNGRISDLESAIDRALAATEAALQNLDQLQARGRLRGDELEQEVSNLVQAKASAETVGQLASQVESLERSAARAERVEAIASQLRTLAEETVDLETHNKLALQLGDLAGSTPRRRAFEELVRRVDEANRRAVDPESHERLSRELAALNDASARRDVVEELARRLDETNRRSVDVETHERLGRELAGLRETSAQREVVEGLVRRLDEVNRRAVDLESHERLGRALAALQETSARSEDVEDLARRLDETVRRAVDVESHERLSRELAVLRESSPRREQLDELARRLEEAERRAVAPDVFAALSGELSDLQEATARREDVEALSLRLDDAERRAVAPDVLAALRGDLATLQEAAARREDVDSLSLRLDDAERRSVDPDAHERLAREIAVVVEQRQAESEQLEAVHESLQTRLEALRTEQHEQDGQSAARIGALRERVDQLEAASRAQRLSILEEQRKYDVLLEQTRKRLPKELDASQLAGVLADEEHARDAIYAGLEDRFRGTREEIKQRLREYVPRAAEAVKATRGAPMLDLGCGRGEWLEVADDEGWTAGGIDTNRIMLQRCTEQGFEVEEGEALEFLRNQRSRSLSVVTGFHIIEHVPFSEVVSLFDETLRVLRKGGVAIFETPNPENLLVGACNFYADPTHRNPIFPPTLEFILRERGFRDVELVRPWRGGGPSGLERLPESDPLAERLNPILELLDARFGPSPDFAAIGRKA